MVLLKLLTFLKDMKFILFLNIILIIQIKQQVALLLKVCFQQIYKLTQYKQKIKCSLEENIASFLKVQVLFVSFFSFLSLC